jgi:predicted  nucleic acid-binding Zn-ribbon protein
MTCPECGSEMDEVYEHGTEECPNCGFLKFGRCEFCEENDAQTLELLSGGENKPICYECRADLPGR